MTGPPEAIQLLVSIPKQVDCLSISGVSAAPAQIGLAGREILGFIDNHKVKFFQYITRGLFQLRHFEISIVGNTTDIGSRIAHAMAAFLDMFKVFRRPLLVLSTGNLGAPFAFGRQVSILLGTPKDVLVCRTSPN